MFALPKLVVIVLLAAGAWVSYRWLNGVTRDLLRREPAPPRASIVAEDLVACDRCGAYVAMGAPGCGRADCPRSR
jgi:hypothetical protein